MADPAVPQAHTAWLPLSLSLWRTLLARYGLRLLAVELIITLTGVVQVLPWLLTGMVSGGMVSGVSIAVVGLVLSIVVGSFLTAWAWSAGLAILSQDLAGDPPRVTVAQALRAGLRGGGLRGVMRLWAWLALLQVLSLQTLLIYLDVDLLMAYARSPFSMLFQALSWYVAFATALLPMTILLERRGIGRAWLLAHGTLGTVAGIVALLTLSLGVERLLDELPSGPAETLSSMAIGIPLSVLTSVGFYVIYLTRTGAIPVEGAAPLSQEDSDTH